MGALMRGCALRVLLYLLREGDGQALLGDLDEERARRTSASTRIEASQWYTRQLYVSVAAVLRLRALECIRATPWGIAAAAYLVVGVFEVGSMWLLSRTWPEAARSTSALRLALEFPGIVAIAYGAARFHRSAAFVLGAMMLVVAAVLNTVTAEAISATFIVAFLVLGPLAAVLGGMLRRRRDRVA
jgi:hypothetical protein